MLRPGLHACAVLTPSILASAPAMAAAMRIRRTVCIAPLRVVVVRPYQIFGASKEGMVRSWIKSRLRPCRTVSARGPNMTLAGMHRSRECRLSIERSPQNQACPTISSHSRNHPYTRGSSRPPEASGPRRSVRLLCECPRYWSCFGSDRGCRMTSGGVRRKRYSPEQVVA